MRAILAGLLLTAPLACTAPDDPERAHRRLLSLLELSRQTGGLEVTKRLPTREEDCFAVPGFFKTGKRRRERWELRVSPTEAARAADALERLWRAEKLLVRKEIGEGVVLVTTDGTGAKFSVGLSVFSSGTAFLVGDTGC